MNPTPTLTAFLAGALVGGAIADSTEAFALLFGLGVGDSERTVAALSGAEGKRLKYRETQRREGFAR